MYTIYFSLMFIKTDAYRYLIQSIRIKTTMKSKRKKNNNNKNYHNLPYLILKSIMILIKRLLKFYEFGGLDTRVKFPS